MCAGGHTARTGVGAKILQYMVPSLPDRLAPSLVADTAAIPILVHSPNRDSVEALNSVLRNGGLAAHCTWIPAAQDLADALEQLNPELLVCYSPATRELVEIAKLRDVVAASVPIIVVREILDAQVIGEDLTSGARASLAVQAPVLMLAVIQRELRAYRIERTLTATLRSAQDYRRQLETVLRGSQDAIAQVQEGIIVEANDSWLELYGLADASAIIGQPVMDLFDAETHTPLKGALAACAQGRWNSGHALRANARLPDGSVVSVELQLNEGEFDGEHCVRLAVPAYKRDDKQMATDLAEAVYQDPSTGLWTRRHLLDLLTERLATSLPGGVRCLVCVRPDKLAPIEREVGVHAIEPLLSQIAALVRTMLGPNDIAGHFGGTRLLLMLERGNRRDVEAWCDSLVERIGRHPFEIAQRMVTINCSVGLASIDQGKPDLSASVLRALDGARRARELGGDQVHTVEPPDPDSRVLAYDQVWVKHIKAALMENRFRLVQQPIASLTGEDQTIFDIAVRMLDTQGREVLPTEFLPAAARNDLLKNIDRWVLAAALSFVAKSKPDLAFVRLAKDSVLDLSLVGWLDTQLKSTQADPQRLCLQVTEEVAANNLAATKRLAGELKDRQLKFALEHCGTRSNSRELLQSLPLDFAKIDGSLMQGLSSNPEQQQKVRLIAEAAHARNVRTVAERIEDANTMAVVWQLGVQYIQGYLVHSPEKVVLTS